MGQEEQRPLRRRQTWSSWGDGAFNCRILGVWGVPAPSPRPCSHPASVTWQWGHGGGGAPAAPALLLGFFPPPLIHSACSTTLRGGGRRGGTSPESQSLAGDWPHVQLQGATSAASQAEEEVPGLSAAFRAEPAATLGTVAPAMQTVDTACVHLRGTTVLTRHRHLPRVSLPRPSGGEETCPASRTAGQWQRPDPTLALSGYILLWRIF